MNEKQDGDSQKNNFTSEFDDVESSIEEIKKKIKENSITKEQLFQWFKEEIDRRDSEIEKLRRDNDILFQTALKAKASQLDDKNKNNSSPK